MLKQSAQLNWSCGIDALTFLDFNLQHIFTMVRGADFDNGIPQSDNPIEAGETKAHGVGNPVSVPI